MVAVEIDPRAVAMLNAALPELQVVESDVLQVRHVETHVTRD
jgi:16S rRNA A1518/A1519 N6-dimethyltransferase RsmA/KsgA/DIM1 with predicted DNA glycosylase/AP lyase activity